MKPGYKTSEFWLTLAAMVCGVLLASGAIPSSGKVYSVIVAVAGFLASMGYTYGRSTVKAASAGASSLTANISGALPGIDGKAIGNLLSAQKGSELIEPKP